MLLDLYGEALTNKQRDYLNFYYNDDLSLSEIAENEGITRQGVRDAIKRAEALLFDMESKLKFSKKLEKINNGLAEISKHAEDINEYNLANGLSREINDKSVKIKSIALSLTE
ncbi:MAG: DNA-binding protein [Clostridia bacterium]|nr:DNA-binding protein [Clostridia bacterium]